MHFIVLSYKNWTSKADVMPDIIFNINLPFLPHFLLVLVPPYPIYYPRLFLQMSSWCWTEIFYAFDWIIALFAGWNFQLHPEDYALVFCLKQYKKQICIMSYIIMYNHQTCSFSIQFINFKSFSFYILWDFFSILLFLGITIR